MKVYGTYCSEFDVILFFSNSAILIDILTLPKHDFNNYDIMDDDLRIKIDNIIASSI